MKADDLGEVVSLHTLGVEDLQQECADTLETIKELSRCDDAEKTLEFFNNDYRRMCQYASQPKDRSSSQSEDQVTRMCDTVVLEMAYAVNEFAKAEYSAAQRRLRGGYFSNLLRKVGSFFSGRDEKRLNDLLEESGASVLDEGVYFEKK